LLFGPVGVLVAGPLAGWLGARHALLVVAASVVVPTALALLSPGVRNMQMPAAVDGDRADLTPVTSGTTVIAPLPIASAVGGSAAGP
jgi:hypothetical protein